MGITFSKARDIFANRFDFARELGAEDFVPGSQQTERDSGRQPKVTGHVEAADANVGDGDSGGVAFDD
jgi:hypothetical protein